MRARVNRFPDELNNFLHLNFGDITDLISLPGIAGDGGATRLQLTGGHSVVVKSTLTSGERHFYEQHAGILRRAGVGVPDLYWSGSDDEQRNWIVLEDIPVPFPKERWVSDAEQFEMLFHLHSTTWGNRCLELNEAAFQPIWNAELTERACEWFDDVAERNSVMNQFIQIQREVQFLFEPTCCLSADPNPTNWRIRENGKLVLIDWERFCNGHPAIDLAITMPGIGSKDGAMERRIAELYLGFWTTNTGRIPSELDDLERWIRVAKLWSIVEFIANAKLKPALYPKDTVTYIVRELPSVLGQLA